MTKREKIAVLKHAIKIIECYADIRHSYGICYAMRQAFIGTFTFRDFAEFGIKELPRDIFGYWFPTNKEGDKKRIVILRKVIKKLQS